MTPASADQPDPGAWRLPGFSFVHLPGGARNTVLRGTGPGSGYVFKRTRRTEAQLRWLRHVRRAADLAGLQVSLPLETVFGWLAHRGWIAERFVEGHAAMAADMAALAPQVARFHAAATGTPQRPGFATAHDLVRAETGGDIDLAAMPPTLRDLCRTAWARLPEGGTTLIHADLSPANVILSGDGTPVLLDWDEARADLPVFDRLALGDIGNDIDRAAALAFEIAVCWCIEPERARSLARDLPQAVASATT